MLRDVTGVEIEDNYLKVTTGYSRQDEVRKVVEGHGLTLVEILAGDLTDLYRKLVRGEGEEG